MAAGFRSLAFWWFTGYSAGASTPTDLCPCPTYNHDATLSDVFTMEASLSNQFAKDATLSNQFAKDGTLSNQFSKTETLTSSWKRGTCNG